MQQLRQIIPALMIGVLAGGIGTFQSLQSNQANILSSSYGNGGNPTFTTQSVAGTRELPPSDGGTEDLKIGKTFIPCPGSEALLRGEEVIPTGTPGTLERGHKLNGFTLSIAKGITKKITAEVPFAGGTHLLCDYWGANNFCQNTSSTNEDGLAQAWLNSNNNNDNCTAINEPTRIGFECGARGDAPDNGGLGQ